MVNKLLRAAVALFAVCAIAQIAGDPRLRASANGIVISQVYGGGGNAGATYRNDFIELYNVSGVAVDLTGWSVQYASSTGASWTKTPLSGVIQPGKYFLVQEAQGTGGSIDLPSPDAVGTIAMSATAGKVALVDNSTTLSGTCPLASIVDFVGFGGANCYEGTGPAPTLSNTAAALRNNGGAVDTDDNKNDFIVGVPNPHSGGNLRTTAASNPAVVDLGASATLTVTVAPGTNPPSNAIGVAVDLSAFGGSPSQPMFDDGTHGDVVAGDKTFTFVVGVPLLVGGNPLVAVASDDRGRSAAVAIPLRLNVPIHTIQGRGITSPLASWPVRTEGIVTGVKYNGFFIQAPASEYDDDANTSEGIFVFTSSAPPASAVYGNRVQVTAAVSEYGTTGDPAGLSMTELTGPTVTLESTANTAPDPIVLSSTDLDPHGSIFQLEKYEGMRVHVDSVVSTSPTGGTVNESNAASVSSGLFFGVLPGIARPYREPGIETPFPVPSEAAAGAAPPVFDANPERIGVDTFSVFQTPSAAAVYPPPAGSTLEVTSGVTVNGVTGPLEYAFHSYIVDADGWEMPTIDQSTSNAVATAVRDRSANEFTVATANLERFFDTENDPKTSDVVLTSAAYAGRLAKASLTIRHVLKLPDIVGVEEVENLATLQDIAARVNADAAAANEGTPDYHAYLEEGNDVGGIDSGLLVRGDRVNVSDASFSVVQYGKDATFAEPQPGGNPNAILNDRPPLVLHGSILNPPYDPYPVTVIVNHLRSLSGIEGADGWRVRAKRRSQAEYLAALIRGFQANGEHVISVGDYNAYDVNDGYVDVIGIVRGSPAPSAEVTEDTVLSGGPSGSLPFPPLSDLVTTAPAQSRYSFLFDGNAQELDHILVTPELRVTGFEYGRSNADFPESYRGDFTRPERLSDHDPLVAYFSTPDITAPELRLPTGISVEGDTLGGAHVTFAASAHDAVDGDVVPDCTPASGSLFPVGTTTVSCAARDGAGNSTSGSFDVTVTDTTPPAITAARPSVATLWPPNHAMVPVTIRVTAVDVVDAAPACRITGVTGNDHATMDDWEITAALGVNLRAARTGGGAGRTYTIAVQCEDASHNVSVPAMALVFVPHDERK